LLNLLDAYQTWPPNPADNDRWLKIAFRAAAATPLDDGYRLAIVATELALRTSQCLPAPLELINRLIERLARQKHAPRFDSPLKALAEADRELHDPPYGHCPERINALPRVVP
jgi:hypothetical protein